jgi:hypothetical protein
VKRHPPAWSSKLLSPKAAVGWEAEAEAEAELIRRVEGLEATTWRNWTRRGWGMRHGVEREGVVAWCCCSIFCIGKQEREGGREREMHRGEKLREGTDKDKAHAHFIKKPFYIFYFFVNG